MQHMSLVKIYAWHFNEPVGSLIVMVQCIKHMIYKGGVNMALTNEDLLAISQLLDSKLKPISDDVKVINLTLENDILPRLQNIESCYTSTYKRY